MNLHREISFEDEICAHLEANGWLYEQGSAAHYDRQRALFPADIVAWIEQTQPKAWAALSRGHGAGAEVALLDRVRKQIDDRGALDVIRHGVDMVGVQGRITFAQFRPAFDTNPDIIAACVSTQPGVSAALFRLPVTGQFGSTPAAGQITAYNNGTGTFWVQTPGGLVAPATTRCATPIQRSCSPASARTVRQGRSS